MSCPQDTAHRPLLMGSNLIPRPENQVSGGGAGTLGCFAQSNASTARDNIYVLSNNHVLGHNGLGNEATVAQCHIQDDNQRNFIIGRTANVGMKGNFSYQYTGDPAPLTYYIDCGIVKVATNYSSWCNTNSGIHWKNEFRLVHPDGGPTRLSGIYRITQEDLDQNRTNKITVFKVGGRTGATKGRIVQLLDVPGIDDIPGYDRVMEIQLQGDTCLENGRFADEGDSGSIIVNQDGEAVGLFFSSAADQVNGLACHIHPVLAFLGITLVTTSTPAVGSEGKDNAPGTFVFNSPAAGLEELVASHPRGEQLMALFTEHRAEIIELVNHHRPVSVAWLRIKGPAFFGHVLEKLRNPSHQVPAAMEGIALQDAWETLVDVLAQHGSPALREVCIAAREDVTQLLCTLVEIPLKSTESPIAHES
jgi:hypothetical protein